MWIKNIGGLVMAYSGGARIDHLFAFDASTASFRRVTGDFGDNFDFYDRFVGQWGRLFVVGDARDDTRSSINGFELWELHTDATLTLFADFMPGASGGYPNVISDQETVEDYMVIHANVPASFGNGFQAVLEDGTIVSWSTLSDNPADVDGGSWPIFRNEMAFFRVLEGSGYVIRQFDTATSSVTTLDQIVGLPPNNAWSLTLLDVPNHVYAAATLPNDVTKYIVRLNEDGVWEVPQDPSTGAIIPMNGLRHLFSYQNHDYFTERVGPEFGVYRVTGTKMELATTGPSAYAFASVLDYNGVGYVAASTALVHQTDRVEVYRIDSDGSWFELNHSAWEYRFLYNKVYNLDASEIWYGAGGQDSYVLFENEFYALPDPIGASMQLEIENGQLFARVRHDNQDRALNVWSPDGTWREVMRTDDVLAFQNVSYIQDSNDSPDGFFGNHDAETIVAPSSTSTAVWARGGEDTIITGDGDDTIHAGAAADLIQSGGGADHLWGGGGADTFVFDSLDTGNVIADFQYRVDRIDLDALLQDLNGYVFVLNDTVIEVDPRGFGGGSTGHKVVALQSGDDVHLHIVEQNTDAPETPAVLIENLELSLLTEDNFIF